MPEPDDTPLMFHPSFTGLIDSYRTALASLTWLRASPEAAEKYFEPWPYVLMLDCSVSDEVIKVDKSAFRAFRADAATSGTPLFASTLVNLCRVITISVKDIIWEHSDFEAVRNDEALQFLRHVRNAAAHDNRFYFGEGKQRERTLAKLPARWRNKTIDQSLENSPLFLDFLGAGDLLFLLSDVTSLATP